MVDIDIGSSAPCGTVEGRVPAAGGSSAVRTDDDVGAVTLEDSLAGVACAADGNPVIEETTAVSCSIGGANRERS